MQHLGRLTRALALAVAIAPAAALAQGATPPHDGAAAQAAKPDLRAPIQAGSIDPGMTREQVVEQLGEPSSVRSHGRFTYLFYHNGCEKTCGMSDLVVLEDGKVTDAIFRAAERHFTGTSSSPAAKKGAPRGNGTLRVSPSEDGAPSAEDEAPARPPARVTSVQIQTVPASAPAAAAAPRDSARPPD